MSKIMAVIYHMSVMIESLLTNTKGKKSTFYHDNGERMSDKEAREELRLLIKKGHKLIPLDNCECFDPFGGGCPGHEVKEDTNQNAKP